MIQSHARALITRPSPLVGTVPGRDLLLPVDRSLSPEAMLADVPAPLPGLRSSGSALALAQGQRRLRKPLQIHEENISPKHSLIASAKNVVAIAFALVCALMVIPAYAPTLSLNNKGGIFSLYPRNDQLNNTEELNLPYVAGLSVRYGWSDIERSPGEYNWSSLEKAHRIADQNGKLLIIRIIAGSASPKWIYPRGVPAVTFQGSETNWMAAGTVGTMPVPWNENYLQLWGNFLDALGKEISGWKNVYCVQMTGGGFIDEMHLPKKSPETIQQWNNVGISDEKLVAMWMKIIEVYDRVIPPGIGLTLDLGVPFAQSRTPDLVYQYALAHYPRRVWFQQNGLKAERAPDAKFPEMIRAASTRTIVGYQMLGGGKFLDAQTGNRKTAFENAIKDHSSYVEVYKADLVDPELSGAMTFLANGLLDYNKSKF